MGKPSFYSLSLGLGILMPVIRLFRNQWTVGPDHIPGDMYRNIDLTDLVKCCLAWHLTSVGAINNQTYPFLAYHARIAEILGAGYESTAATCPPCRRNTCGNR